MSEIEHPPSERNIENQTSLSQLLEFLLLGILWGLTSAALACISPASSAYSKHLVIGFLVGPLFGHTTGISIWASLGQHCQLLRGMFAVFYLFGMWAALLVGLANQGVGYLGLAIGVGVAIILQAPVVFACCWLAKVLTGLRLVPQSALASMKINFQFKIKHMMTLTLFIACLTAVGRELTLSLLKSERNYEGIIVFLFLGMTNILITIPIAFACFLQRYFVFGLIVAMLGCSVITAVEHSVYTALINYYSLDFYHMFFINLFSVVFVIIFSIGLRWGVGYRLSIGQR